jgi:CheY-like chemotaxis protein
MDAPRRAIWFFGDLDDPWVVSIADAIPAGSSVQRVDCSAQVPERPFAAGRPPCLVILHRSRMTAQDCERLRTWRDRGAAAVGPALILCASPYLRYEELERAAGLVDRVLPEATAPDVIAGHAARLLEGRGCGADLARTAERAFRIEIAGGTGDLVAALVDACTSAGHTAQAIADLAGAAGPRGRISSGTPGQRVLTIWEVPVLEPRWTERLAQRARDAGPVIALLGMADRGLVTQAKNHGAAGCLDLPCDLDELLDLIERVAARQPLEGWPLLYRAEPAHLLPPPSRRRAVPRGLSSPAVWPEQDERTTIL